MTNNPANIEAPAAPYLARPQRFQKMLNWARLGYTLPLLVFAVSLAITLNIWKGVQQNSKQELQSRFNSVVRETNSHIGQRIKIYEQALRGVDGLFAHAESVKRNEFREYVARLKLAENYPGIHGVGFALIVPEAEKDRHIAAIRKQGFHGYTIKPEGEREIYTAVTYIEPFNEHNLRAFGYDMYSEPVRRAAMEQARDSGNIAISGKVRLLMDSGSNSRPGFLMYLPVYKYGAPHEALADRRANIIGWAYAPFRLHDLMEGILGDLSREVDMEIYDGAEVSDKTLMFDTDGVSGSGLGASFQAVTRMEFGGHVWTVTTRSRPAFDALSDKWKSRLIAYDGIGMSLLVALLTWLLVHGRVQAIGMAQAMNKDVIKKERELRSLFDNASEGIWVFNADKRTIKVNQALLKILGASEDELIGKSVYDFLDRGGAGVNLSSNSGQQKSGNNQYSEVELRCADGRRIFCQFNTSRIYDEASNSTSLLAMVTDITGRKQLELQKEQYLKFFTFSLDMMCIVGADGFFKKVNPAFIKTIGYPEKEILEKPMVEILVTDDHPASLGEVVGQVRGRVTQDYENRYLCKDGSFRWLSWRAFTDAADGLVYATARDITERKRMESALLEGDEAYRCIQATSFDGFWVLDMCGKILDVNERYCEQSGYTREEMLGMVISDLEVVESMEETASHIQRVIETGRDQFESKHRRKDGSVWHVEVSTVYQASKEGRLFAFMRDITERKRFEQQLRQDKERFRAIYEGSNDAVMLLTKEGFIDCNARTLKMFGLASKLEFTSRHPSDLSPPFQHGGLDSTTEANEKISAALQHGSIRFEWMHRRKNGEDFPAEVLLSAFDYGGMRILQATVRDITERKRVENALLESIEDYHCIQSTSFDGFWILGAGGKILEVNERYCEQSGYSRKELLGMSVFGLEVIESEAETTARMRRLIETGRGQFESMHRRKDGSTWCVEVSVVFMASRGGRFFAFMRDITGRKRAVAALRVSEERFRSVFDYSRAGMVLADASLNFLKVNRAFCRMLGYAEEELLASDLKGITYPGDIEPNLSLSMRLLAGEIDYYHLEKRYIRKDGGILWGDLTVSAVRNGSGKLNYVIAIIQDVTQRRNDEELLRKLFTAIEQSPVSVVITDTGGNIEYVNPKFAAVTGYTAPEVIGQNPHILKSGQTPKETYRDLWGKISGGQVWHGEILNRRKSGENYWEEVHIAPVKNTAGDITHYVSLKTDISERIKSRLAIERISLLYKMLGDMNSANIHARDREGLFNAACRIAVESGLFHMAWIGLLDRMSGDVIPVAHAGFVDGYLDHLQININHGERGDGPTARAIKSGTHTICKDFATDPIMRPWREEALKRGYRASIVLPLTQRDMVIGAFTLYFRETGFLSDDVIQLLDSLAADISFTLGFMAESLEREKVQRDVQELSLFLETAREDERKHLARELHDELGQTMTALRFDLNWLGDNLQAQDDVVSGKIKVMKEVVVQTVDAIRRISEDLRPGMLDDLGLAAAIENHVTKFARGTGITCDLVMSQEDFNMDEQVATALFRIVQESLTNVARHSGADLATIQLHELKDNILLVVQDNGRGLPPVPEGNRRTFGLVGMRERVKMLGGTLDIFSEPGAGVRVEASISRHSKRNVQ